MGRASLFPKDNMPIAITKKQLLEALEGKDENTTIFANFETPSGFSASKPIGQVLSHNGSLILMVQDSPMILTDERVVMLRGSTPPRSISVGL